jgi:murein DD-endopeptidase MepM/ murein hydrolase activator NlpD
MTHHISHVVLLPQGAGWEWYEAMSDYIRRYRPTITHSADDAVSFRGQTHTVTVVNPAAWKDDIVAWLKNPRHTGGAQFEVDVVRAASPEAVRREMAKRVLETGRTGKGLTGSTQPTPPQPKPQPVEPVSPEQKALQLVWPTDYKVFTQKFGQRPEYYSKFGLPGHEGVDIRCPTGTNVYSCADGAVTQVGWRTPNHAYGYSVRTRHKRVDGEYELIYAHLVDGSAKVNVGDAVKAGQLIALGDNTGNSSAAHLHLSLKKIGAKNGGYGEIIDPEPFFVDPPQ